MFHRLNSIRLTKLLRIALGSALAILIANALFLQYSTAAGIITLLTIQNTRKETIAISVRRFQSFLLAILLAVPLFTAFGYHPFVFGLFLLLFAGLSELFSLQDGISINAVLTTHFLIEQSMSISLIINELMLLMIGVSIGVGLNMLIRQQTKQVSAMIIMIDEIMKKNLTALAAQLRHPEITECSVRGKHNLTNNVSNNTNDFQNDRQLFDQIIRKIQELQNNQLRGDLDYYVTYCHMRSNQLNILENIQHIIDGIPAKLPQAEVLSDYLDSIAAQFHQNNQVIELLNQFDLLLDHYQSSDLPATRIEFEVRARLFQILILSRQFLMLKRQFADTLTERDKTLYWQVTTR